jgi:VWFA-related protein
MIAAGAGRLLAAPGTGDFVLRSDVRLVLLDVSVGDRDGAPVSGLSKENFVVLENGKPETIKVFGKSDMPVTIGLLVDDSGSMKNKRQDVIQAADAFIAESNPRDEMFVLNFNDSVKRGLPDHTQFSDDRAALHRALERGAARGMTALNDAIVDGIEHLKAGTRDRKALVIVSDGGDNASTHTAKAVDTLIESHLATIYAVGIYDPDDRETNPGFLRRIARTSGGQIYFPKQPADVLAACKSIAHDIRSRYTIGYTPDPERDQPEIRHIAVRLTGARNGLSVRTRTSYRYDKP